MTASLTWIARIGSTFLSTSFLLLPMIGLPSAGGSHALAKQVHLDVALAYPTMLLDEQKKSENHLRIAMTGFELSDTAKRAPVNLAIVIDRSGSMGGDKISQAREAAVQAIDRLRADDIVSVVVYDTGVEVLVPATKATDGELIKQRIRSIHAGGNTALFAGVSKGAAEVRKFLDPKRVNRVILLSDGLANVGPSSPSELGQLGTSLIKEGISVSTMGLGLGYNEDLMSRLAIASSGNHTFIESADNLVAVFQREFDDVLSVVAQKIEIRVVLDAGVRPVKVLNYPAGIDGQTVTIELGQLYSKQERYFVIEVEIPHGQDGTSRQVAEVTAQYRNAVTDTQDTLTSRVEGRFSSSKKTVETAINKAVLSSCVIQIANERNAQATSRRDNGDLEGAKKLLLSNSSYLDRFYSETGNEELRQRAVLNKDQAGKLSEKDWNRSRKLMREAQAADTQQQVYSGAGAKVGK